MSDKTPGEVAYDAWQIGQWDVPSRRWDGVAKAVLDQFGSIPEGHVAVPVEALEDWANATEAFCLAAVPAEIRSYIPEPPNPDAELIETLTKRLRDAFWNGYPANDPITDEMIWEKVARAALAVVREQEGQA